MPQDELLPPYVQYHLRIEYVATADYTRQLLLVIHYIVRGRMMSDVNSGHETLHAASSPL